MDISEGRLRQTFLELIAINSYYPEDLAVRDYVAARCEQAGVPYELDDFGNLIARLSGNDNAPAVMLNTHLDIPEDTPAVAYCETGEGVEGTGETILGADPKTGLAVLLELITALAKDSPKSRAPVDFVFTRGEEQGLLGAHALDMSKVRAKQGFVLDEDGPPSVIVIEAPGSVQFEGEFLGKTVHPREPWMGLNALQMAAEAIHEVPLGYSDKTKQVTWNLGIFGAGTASNSIPGSAYFKAEFRSVDNHKLQFEAQRVYDLFAKIAQDAGGQLDAKLTTTATPYNIGKADPLIANYIKSLSKFSRNPSFLKTFGQSDANVLNHRGIHCLPLGTGYYHAHQYTESANLKDMQTLAQVLHHFATVK
jgi:tripeptide aminopeptidase